MLRSENRIAQLTVDRQRTFAISVTVILVLITVVLIVVYLSRRMKIRSLTLVEEKNLIIERKSSQLEESNTLKELLLDIITHDLINPVSTITGAADLLRENPGDERIIDIIDKSSRHVSEVAQNAAALSRVVIDGEIPKEPLSLHDLVETVREEFRTAFERKGMAFENRIPAGLQIDANPVLIEVYRNFASNALRYASEGGKVIVRSDEALDAVTVCFVDFGQTIPEQMRERIFLRRVQVEPGRRRGSGLGLAIVERIVRAHGGTAWVEPNSPKGNVFCVKLPRDHA